MGLDSTTTFIKQITKTEVKPKSIKLTPKYKDIPKVTGGGGAFVSFTVQGETYLVGHDDVHNTPEAKTDICYGLGRFIAAIRQNYPTERISMSSFFLDKNDLSGLNMSKVDLPQAIMFGSNLSDCNLSESNLNNSNLSGANLTRADLSNTDLRSANLYAANLTNCILVRTNLNSANLSQAILNGADLSNADLTGADLSGVKYDIGTTFPSDFDNNRLDIRISDSSIE